MSDFLSTVPFDLYELALFRLVVKHGSFTKAAVSAGLTQSAITRQVQGMENSLGVELLERTTRSVRTTAAGEFLFRESASLLGNAEQTLRELREEFAGARKEVRVGVSRTIGLAHLPGFFHANLHKNPQVGCRMTYESSVNILAALEENELDLGVICPPKRLPRTLRITHRFEDAFTVIAPHGSATVTPALPLWCRGARRGTNPSAATSRKLEASLKEWLGTQNWLLIEEGSNTGRQLRTWLNRQKFLPSRFEPAMRLDSFDLIINLVALGMGVSIVPIRCLALYGRRRNLQRLPLTTRFVREIVVVTRRHRKIPQHLKEFVENVLF